MATEIYEFYAREGAYGQAKVHCGLIAVADGMRVIDRLSFGHTDESLGPVSDKELKACFATKYNDINLEGPEYLDAERYVRIWWTSLLQATEDGFDVECLDFISKHDTGWQPC